MSLVEETTGGIIARAILKRARDKAFGVLVRDVPEFKKESLIAALSPSASGRVAIRLAMPGLSDEEAKTLRAAASRVGFSSGRFVTTVEGAEKWRNDPQVQETIVVVTPGDLPKLNSLNRFQTVSGSDLHSLLCEEGEKNLAPNDAQRQLWKALRSKELTALVPLDGLLAFWTDLSNCSENQIPVRSREYLPRLGLLPDPELFQSPTAAKITHRLLDNFRIVDQLRILSRSDRQRISRSLAKQGGDAARLKSIYARVMRFHREQNPELLKDLSLTDAQALLRETSESPDEPSPRPQDPSPASQATTETRPEVRALDLLVEGDLETLKELGGQIIEATEAESNGGDPEEAIDSKTGVRLDISLRHPFLRLVERCVSRDHWGGFVATSARTLDEALALLDKADIRPFEVDGSVRPLRSLLQEVVEMGADSTLLTAYDEMRSARASLADHVRSLLLEPFVYLNSSSERFSVGEKYLNSYRQLIEGLKRGYETIATNAPEGVEILCSQILALDTILLRTDSGFKAVLSPLHPLHVWKFIELGRQVRAQNTAITEREWALLRSKADDLPNFVTTLYLSNYITNAGPKLLPEAGVRQGLPYFEELAHQYAGRDGLTEVVRLLERFCSLYPHARLGLRIALVDPPELEFVLTELVRLADRQGDNLQALHVRVYYTSNTHSPVAGLGGGAEDEEGAERFRGVGSSARFTLEVSDQAINARTLADKLADSPVHVAVYFDPSAARAQRFPRAPSLRVHPLCLPMQFSFDRLTKTVRVVPAADGGIFSEHNDLRNRLSNVVGSSFYGVTAELQAESDALRHLAGRVSWLVIADRAQEGALAFEVPRVALQRCNKRDVAVYANDQNRFVRELDSQLRRCNYTPSATALNRLVSDLNLLLNDGLLSLVSTSASSPAVDEKRTRGLLGTLVAAEWYRRTHPASLVVSIDSPEARRWLELRETRDRADLFGVTSEPDGGYVVDLMEVKTYQDPSYAYELSGKEISGDAVDQLIHTSEVIQEVFIPAGASRRIVAPQRREILRQHLFRECFFEGRSDEDRQTWSQRLNDLFALEARARIRLSLVVVGLTQVHDVKVREFVAQGQAIRLIELAEDEVRAYVGEPVPPQSPSINDPPIDPGDSNGGDEGGAGGSSASEEASDLSDAASSPSPQGPDESADGARSPDEQEQQLIERQATSLRRILRDYGVQIQELDPEKAQIGPSIIRYRVRLRPGAKLAALRTRAEDIGRELAARSTPFIDNVAGEHYVGIDLERPKRQIVSLLPAIDALPPAGSSKLPVAVGVAPDGTCVTLDLVQLPHLLIAGSTLSGKTVFLHALLLSLVAHLPDDRLELIIIDPKATDFVLYNGLPHLRDGRVITEPEHAIAQLRALTNDEMRERTGVLQQARLPNLSEYNAKHPSSPMRPIVVVIDEYADLVAVLSKRERGDFEKEINRLAQRARSVGIHLVLATQRPTADIVTGLLKANMPARISFRLPQRVDSQTILDQSGAENLLGRGDMLLMLNDRLVRLQGYYISPADMTAFLAARFPGSGFAPDVGDILDLDRDDSDPANHEALVGEITCLAASEDASNLADGDVMILEVERRTEEGPEVIGLSGEVLKQSALAAWRYVQQHANDYGIKRAQVQSSGISLHLVNIARYREGPSAGIAIVTAIISAFTGRAVKSRVAMSGEVSLKGHVGAVGGIAQKLVAAWRRGRTLIILPSENRADVELVPVEIRRDLTIHFVDNVKDAIALVLEV